MEPLRIGEVLIGHQDQDDYNRCEAGLQVHQKYLSTMIRMELRMINARPMNHNGENRAMTPTKMAKILKDRMGFTWLISLSYSGFSS